MIEEQIYESTQRLKWFIDGYFMHGISIELFKNLTTKRLCELYNIEESYFKLKK